MYILHLQTPIPVVFWGGGSGTLIDKGFSQLNVADSNDTYFTPSDNCNAGVTFLARRSGRHVHFRIQFTNAVAIGDTQLTIGTIDLEKLGIAQMSTHRFPGYTDGGNDIVMFVVYGNTGNLDTVDVAVNASVAAGATFLAEFDDIITTASMLDSACNQFYGKRIA